MAWTTAGSVALALDSDWQYLGLPLIYGAGQDVALFRVEHSWNGTKQPYGKAWMAAWFQGQETFALFDSLPVRAGKRLIYSPLPLAYQQAGFTSRTIAIKPDHRVRTYPESGWTVTVEYFLPEPRTEPDYPELLELAQVEEALDNLDQQLEQLTDSLFVED